MKFMKLGSRPDTFYTNETVRTVSSEVSSDLIIQVKGTRFLLHKFPLLSKCLLLQRLCCGSPDQHQSRHQAAEVELEDFPGGSEAFEVCAKFCYGITVTISAYNLVPLRCAAEYLQMTEDVEKGNLIYKLEIFFNSCLLHGWKDSILTLQSTKAFHSWSEELGIPGRCIEAIASKVQSHPSKINFSHVHSRRIKDGISSSKGWWGEDLAELGIDLFWRTIIAIRAGGKTPSNLIGETLRIYASRWLPISSKHSNLKKQEESEMGSDSKHRLLLETIISLLPLEKGAVSCSFLLKLLKAANILNASANSKMELARRVGLQLEEAKVNDLLIPSKKEDMVYDVDLILNILEQYFVFQGQSPPTSPPRVKEGFERRQRSRSSEKFDSEFINGRRSSSASHSSKLKVARLVDGFLQEAAADVKLPLSKFIEIAEAVPDFARMDHDDLYKAIDIYLKAHPGLNKSERKRLCRILDCKKLSMEACMHAAQNEMLPLRVVVQVLFFEQARAAMSGGQVTELPGNIKALLAPGGDPRRPTMDDQWSVSALNSPKSRISTLRTKLAEDEDDLDENAIEGVVKQAKAKALCTPPPRPKSMFSKLWSINKSTSEKN
ncbi:hypothetical protein NMG60_11030824 [Bertholletia excelsa]